MDTRHIGALVSIPLVSGTLIAFEIAKIKLVHESPRFTPRSQRSVIRYHRVGSGLESFNSPLTCIGVHELIKKAQDAFDGVQPETPNLLRARMREFYEGKSLR